MKRMMITLFAIGMTAMSSMSMAAMSTSKVRTETRFLTDKMAYELNLTTAQYNDVFEINYDFIDNARYIMDDVVRGYAWAMDDYYDMLDIRNDDLRWVLNSSQYARFMGIDYFFRPIYTSGSRWQFRIYITYTNPSLFYFARPYHYKTYCGGHYRAHFGGTSYYRGRFNHTVYHSTTIRFRNDRTHYTHARRSDFNNVTIRANSSTRPSSTSRRGTYVGSSSSSSVRSSSTVRPNTSSRSSGTVRSSSSSSSSRSSGTTTVSPSTSSSSRRSSSTTTSPATSPNSSRSSSSSSSRSSSTTPSSSSSSSRPSSSSSRSSSSGSTVRSSTPSTSRSNSGSSSSSRSSSSSSSSSSRSSGRR